MKKIKIITLIASIFLAACSNEPNPVDKFFEGKKQLRTINVYDNQKTSWSALYFIIGFGSGGSSTEKQVSFSWKLPDGDFVFSSVPLTSVRIRIDESVKEPYVKFKWESYPNDSKSDLLDVASLIKYRVHYVVIVCNSDQWPNDVDITQLK